MALTVRQCCASMAALLCAGAVGASAQAAPARHPAWLGNFDACMERTEGVTRAMHECIDAERKRQDARLNLSYRIVLAQLPAARAQQLQQVQRLWIRWRDTSCSFYADPEGGTAAGLNVANCLMHTTRERAQALEAMR